MSALTQPIAPTNGIYSDMPESEYFALHRLSQSAIKSILRSPAHYRYGKRKESAAMKQGSLIDVALTEPDKLDRCYHVVPDSFRMDARTGAYKAELEKAGQRELVKQTDMDAALAIHDAVQSHVIASQLIDGAIGQQVALWSEKTEYGRVDMSARLDWINPKMELLIDLKSTADAQNFARTAGNFGYYIQDACYTRGWEQAGGFIPDAFVFIVVEREKPHGIKIYELSARAKEYGLQQYIKGVEIYAKCRKTDNWYGYDGQVEEIDLPRYTYQQTEEF